MGVLHAQGHGGQAPPLADPGLPSRTRRCADPTPWVAVGSHRRNEAPLRPTRGFSPPDERSNSCKVTSDRPAPPGASAASAHSPSACWRHASRSPRPPSANHVNGGELSCFNPGNSPIAVGPHVRSTTPHVNFPYQANRKVALHPRVRQVRGGQVDLALGQVGGPGPGSDVRRRRTLDQLPRRPGYAAARSATTT